MEPDVKVEKWGDDLAVLLPESVIEPLELKEGDEVEIFVTGPRQFEIVKVKSRKEALR